MPVVVATAALAAPIAAIRNAEHTLDAAHDATDTGTNGAADRATHWTSGTIAFTRALICAALHASDNALRVSKIGGH